MAKAEKKNNKKTPEAGEAPAPRGRLVALEGTSGALMRPEAERLARFYSGDGGPAWSLWDASNTFYEMRMVKAKFMTPTPRTLVLLYASDLLFRLRWEIEPTLAEGRSVVAAPYVESVIAFGIAAGLPQTWLEELFSFAPKPEVSYRLKGEKKAKDKKNGNGQLGFVEFFSASLSKQYPGWELADVRAAMVKYLKEKESIHAFGKKPQKI
jgi:thymidylate kinase